MLVLVISIEISDQAFSEEAHHCELLSEFYDKVARFSEGMESMDLKSLSADQLRALQSQVSREHTLRRGSAPKSTSASQASSSHSRSRPRSLPPPATAVVQRPWKI